MTFAGGASISWIVNSAGSSPSPLQSFALGSPKHFSWRRVPYSGPPKIIDLERERLRRMPL